MTVFEHEIDAPADPCAKCARGAARKTRRRSIAKRVFLGFGVGVAFLGVCFVVWTRACIDIEMINAISMLRRSNESLTTELKEVREDSLRQRRNSL